MTKTAKTALFLLLFLAVSQVHALSTSVKVDLLTHKITDALNAKNYAGAVALFWEYDALNVSMSPALLFQRARMYYHQKAYYKTLLTLEKYLGRAKRGSDEYNQALEMYADVENWPEVKIEAKWEAAIRARERNRCSKKRNKHCYIALASPTGCYILHPHRHAKPEWLGACARGFAHGEGTLRMEHKNGWREETGSVDAHGLPQGLWKAVDAYGNQWEFSYVNGKQHGTQMLRKPGGKTSYSCYRNDQKIKHNDPC